jgi:hypothetical protein
MSPPSLKIRIQLEGNLPRLGYIDINLYNDYSVATPVFRIDGTP